MKTRNSITRRQFIDAAAKASLSFTIVPRSVLGGRGYIAPSDKLNIAYIGCGTQGLREMCELLPLPDLQIVSVCDPNKMSTNYVDWSPNGIRDDIRKTLNDPGWGRCFQGYSRRAGYWPGAGGEVLQQTTQHRL